MHPALTIAQSAAFAGGRILLRHLERLDRLTVNAKQRNDFVSEADLQSEREIIRTLRKYHPHHGILAEESGEQAGDGEHQWIIDPLDGTTNFIHGVPHFSVSIALQTRGRLEVGVIYDPIRQEVFAASRGDGAHLNERRIRVRSGAGLEGALLGCGLPFRNVGRLPAYLEIGRALYQNGAMLRQSGSAALDLAYVAAGRLDGFWEFGLGAWDLAAGALLAQEAGALVGDHHGGHDFLATGSIIAAAPKVFKGIARTLRPHLPAGG